MPRIDPKALDCVVYLYDSEEKAKKGTDCGGTGFIVDAPLKDRRDLSAFYCVTNWHVAVDQGNVFVRVNQLNGGTDIVGYDLHDWQFDPRFDIAVAAFPYKRAIHKITMVALEGFLTEALAAEKEDRTG